MPRKKTSTISFNREVRDRIRLSVAAYAYEVEADPIMSDAEFDQLAGTIQPRELTGSPILDLFFLESFEPHTGSWIHEHPDLPGIARLYETHYKDRLI
jgi:hypothetical protein